MLKKPSRCFLFIDRAEKAECYSETNKRSKKKVSRVQDKERQLCNQRGRKKVPGLPIVPVMRPHR